MHTTKGIISMLSSLAQFQRSRKAAPRRLPAVLGLLLAFAIQLPANAAPLPQPAAAGHEWRPAALTVPPSARPEQTFDNRTARICFDTSRPHTFFIWEQEGTVAYNWETAVRTVVN